MRECRGTASTCPIEDFLIDLHQRILGVGGGKVADYIPELGKADADAFGMALATVDGETYATGDADHLFTISRCRSRSCTATRRLRVAPRVQFDRARRSGQAPFNPMVNA